jgi:putative ABC transport system permease protein
MLIVALLSLPFLYIIVRRPILRRLALRNAARRPRETALVILGALLGTAIMTGSFVVGDTFTSSIRRGAFEQLGPVDEVVTGAGLAEGATLRGRLAGFADPAVDGVLPLTVANASAATVATPRRAAPNARLLETDFAAARTFGGDARATGMSGTTPVRGEAAIGVDLAHQLHVGVGDRIEVFAYGASDRLQVSEVLPRRGVAGFWRGDEHTSNNAFVAPGTIASLLARGDQSLGAPPQATVLVSNRGGVLAGAGATVQVSRALGVRLGSLKYTLDAAKSALLERADRNGSSLAQIYSSLGTFGVLAGILLLVNIFFMLADERKSELGMLRAVGLRRASLVGAFAAEGWCYALGAAVAGTFAGLGLGRVMMAFAARLREGGSDAGRLQLHFAFTWASVQRGLVIGFVIAIVTVLLTSVWLSRFNIIRAIRDITETPPHRPHTRSYVFGGALATFGGLLVVLGALGLSFFGLVVGPVFIFVGIGPALARHFKRAHAATVLATAVLFWGVVAVPIALALQSSVSVFMFVAQGLMLVGAAVVLVSQQQHAIGHGVGRVANRSLHVRLGLAYPLARRFRTAMTLGMFALVVFILVYVSVIGAMFAGQLDQFTRDASGDFNVIVSSNPSDPVALDRVARLPGVRAVAPLDALDLLVVRAPGLAQPRQWSGTGFDAAFVRSRPPRLDDRGAYSNDRAAYEAVLADPHLAIVDDFFLAGGAGPPSQRVKVGDQFTVRDLGGGGQRTFTVAALADNDFADNGVLMSRTAARAAFGDRGAPSRAYVDVADPDQFANDYGARFLDHGGRAETIRNTVHDELASQQEFFVLIRGYLALGLIVGIAGIGVIMVRAVRERRRQVGVLRALGVQAAAVRSAFVVESAFVAAEGLVIGTVLALVTAWSITLTDAFGAGMGFRVPVFAIAGVVIGTLVFALLATAAPARAAARIRPAVALRMTD